MLPVLQARESLDRYEAAVAATSQKAAKTLTKRWQTIANRYSRRSKAAAQPEIMSSLGIGVKRG
jgi:hypothetical protein